MGGDCLSRKCVSERKRKLVIGKTSFVRETMLSKAVSHMKTKAFLRRSVMFV